MLGSVTMLFSPVHWLGLVATDVRRIIGLTLDTRPVPRPTQVPYVRTEVGEFAFLPKASGPPSAVQYARTGTLGLDPATGEPQPHLLDDERGGGAPLRSAAPGDEQPPGTVAVPLVDVTERIRGDILPVVSAIPRRSADGTKKSQLVLS